MECEYLPLRPSCSTSKEREPTNYRISGWLVSSGGINVLEWRSVSYRRSDSKPGPSIPRSGCYTGIHGNAKGAWVYCGSHSSVQSSVRVLVWTKTKIASIRVYGHGRLNCWCAAAVLPRAWVSFQYYSRVIATADWDPSGLTDSWGFVWGIKMTPAYETMEEFVRETSVWHSENILFM